MPTGRGYIYLHGYSCCAAHDIVNYSAALDLRPDAASQWWAGIVVMTTHRAVAMTSFC